MRNKFLLLLCVFVITACSSIDKSLPISHIDVLYRGKYQEQRPQMASICKGFFMTTKQVTDFYYNAARINEKEPTRKYEILPCYSTGTAYIYGEKYNWVIRAGGVGEFLSVSPQIEQGL